MVTLSYNLEVIKQKLINRINLYKISLKSMKEVSDYLNICYLNSRLKKKEKSKEKENNKVVLSKCVSEGEYKDWRNLPFDAKEAFEKWFMSFDNKEPFELIIPLHISRSIGEGHWITARIIFIERDGGMFIKAENYNTSGKIFEDSKKAKLVIERIIKDLIGENTDYDIVHEDREDRKIKGINALSCGFYFAEIEKELSKDVSALNLLDSELDVAISKIKLLHKMRGGKYKTFYEKSVKYGLTKEKKSKEILSSKNRLKDISMEFLIDRNDEFRDMYDIKDEKEDEDSLKEMSSKLEDKLSLDLFALDLLEGELKRVDYEIKNIEKNKNIEYENEKDLDNKSFMTDKMKEEKEGEKKEEIKNDEIEFVHLDSDNEYFSLSGKTEKQDKIKKEKEDRIKKSKEEEKNETL